MAATMIPIRLVEHRALRRMCQVLSWAKARSPGAVASSRVVRLVG